MSNALDDLIAKVEAEDHRVGMWQILDDEMNPHAPEYARQAYLGSLDAALALHNAVLPDDGWEVYRTAKYPGMIPGSCPSPYKAIVGWGTQVSAHADTPARAWLIAILKAMKEGKDA